MCNVRKNQPIVRPYECLNFNMTIWCKILSPTRQELQIWDTGFNGLSIHQHAESLLKRSLASVSRILPWHQWWLGGLSHCYFKPGSFCCTKSYKFDAFPRPFQAVDRFYNFPMAEISLISYIEHLENLFNLTLNDGHSSVIKDVWRTYRDLKWN